MKKTFAMVYTFSVLIALFSVVGYLGWDAYKLRAARISDFALQTNDATKRLTDSLLNARNITKEIDLAKELLDENPFFIAIQVISLDDGLRWSAVKPAAQDLKSQSIMDWDKFSRILRFQYHVTYQPMRVGDMPGLRAYFVGNTLKSEEIRQYLLIILVTAGGLFFLTLMITLVKPSPALPRSKANRQDDDIDDTPIPVINIDDIAEETEIDTANISHQEFLEKLEMELVESESFNQDLVLILLHLNGVDANEIRKAYLPNQNVFEVEEKWMSVIQLDTYLTSAIEETQHLIREMQNCRIGITSRINRYITASDLVNEAEKALLKTDSANRIVAFKADPEKYQQLVES